MSKRILLVESEATDEALTRAALESTGISCELTVIRDGQEALDYLLQGKEQPHLVLLDLNLKPTSFSGLDVLKAIKMHEQTRCLPVIVLTSPENAHEAKACYGLGANSFISKRRDAGEFGSVARDVLSYWFEVAKLPPSPHWH